MDLNQIFFLYLKSITHVTYVSHSDMTLEDFDRTDGRTDRSVSTGIIPVEFYRGIKIENRINSPLTSSRA